MVASHGLTKTAALTMRLGLERLLQPRLILGHLRAVLRDLGRLLVGAGDADALVELRAQSLDLQRW